MVGGGDDGLALVNREIFTRDFLIAQPWLVPCSRTVGLGAGNSVLCAATLRFMHNATGCPFSLAQRRGIPL